MAELTASAGATAPPATSSRRSVRQQAKIYFGSDPEIFLSLDGKIVGSERALPETGVSNDTLLSGSYTLNAAHEVMAIRDGIQIELNIPPTHCREWLSIELKAAFQTLHAHLLAQPDRKFEVSFRQVVDVDREELKALSKQSRTLGCAPSFNWHDSKATIGVDPETYTKRSAGGHIHLGLPPGIIPDREQLPPVLDILLGNTSVLIDRDPNTAERRKVYGRAGEFRTPRHGLEYRTLSNFWLRDHHLVSLVLGLARLSVYVLDTTINGEWDAVGELMKMVDVKSCAKAINEGDLALAKENFKGVAEFIRLYHPAGETGLNGGNLYQFDRFIKAIDKGGLESIFREEPLQQWLNAKPGGNGWERWLDRQSFTI